MNEKDYEIESIGYEKGINPFMGRFFRKFNIKPIPYGNPRKSEFIRQVKEQLSDIQYYFFDEVKVFIILYLNEAKRYETHESGDLDNYAKIICDSLKGKGGILIDDTQIQTLTIQWIDTNGEEYFEVEINGRPDDFINKEIKLYEMPNKLYYPLGNNFWTKEGLAQSDIRPLLKLLFSLTKNHHKNKHTLREKGFSREEAYYYSLYRMPVLRGFHKNRILESGFEVVSMNKWRKEYNI